MAVLTGKKGLETMLCGREGDGCSGVRVLGLHWTQPNWPWMPLDRLQIVAAAKSIHCCMPLFHFTACRAAGPCYSLLGCCRWPGWRGGELAYWASKACALGQRRRASSSGLQICRESPLAWLQQLGVWVPACLRLTSRPSLLQGQPGAAAPVPAAEAQPPAGTAGIERAAAPQPEAEPLGALLGQAISAAQAGGQLQFEAAAGVAPSPEGPCPQTAMQALG